MYPVSSAVVGYFKNNPKQELSLTVTPVTGSSFTLTSNDILANGLNVNRYSASGDSVAFGVCSAAELTLSVENYDGRFDNTVFEGAEIYAQIGVKNDATPAVTQWVPLGYFTVDNIPRRLAVIEITALDRMVQFDKPVYLPGLNLPRTVAELVSACCTACNVTLGTTLTSLPNATYQVSEIAEMDDMTYRNILGWCLQIMGCVGYIDWQGQLKVGWYTQAQTNNSPAVNIGLVPADRYSSDFYENEVTITGVIVKGRENQAIYGSEGYALVIDGNNLIDEKDLSTIANGLSSRVGFSYHPFSASVLPMPYLFPLDIVQFTYRDVSYNVAITEVDITSSAPTTIKGTGESAQSRSYARMNPLTARERSIIDALKAEMNGTMSRAVNNAIEFNDMISNALGLYITDVDDGNGGTIRYMHDAPSLEDSTYIVTINAGGFAWSNSWNNGSPVWNYGITASGFAMFKRLSAEGIDVTNVNSRYRAEVTPEHFNVYLDDILIITIDAVNRAIQTPRINVPYSSASDNYIKVGRLMFFPVSAGVDVFLLGE